MPWLTREQDEVIVWQDEKGHQKEAAMPEIVFIR